MTQQLPAESRQPGLVSTNRLEAFSDGVFAIAITLLVLDLAVPARDRLAGRSLIRALGAEWPSYFAYLVSFAVIGIIWVNHHGLCGLVKRADRLVLFANLFLLLTVSVIPFPTRLLAEYLTASGDSHVAAAIYSAGMLAMSIAFSLLFLAISRDARLLHVPLDRATIQRTWRRFSVGGVFYLITIGLSFVSAVLTLVVHALLAAYYCFDQLASARS
jgi:uncharacterized membrane protein